MPLLSHTSLHRRTLILALGLLLAGSLAVTIGCGPTADSSGKQTTPPFNEQSYTPPSDDELRRIVDDAIRLDYTARGLSVTEQAAWQVLHGVVAYGPHTLVADPHGRLTPALDYLFAGGTLNGWNLRPGDRLPNGRQGVKSLLESGSLTGMGHKDQWLGYMAISGCNLPREQKLKVGGREFTIGDWVDQILHDVHEGDEHGWTLMVLAYYIDPRHEWTAGDGQKWTTERVIALEAARDVNKAACGGTHHLGGLTVALQRYLATGGQAKTFPNGADQPPVYTSDGWGAAAKKIDECAQLARAYQQSDGTFSGEYFQRAAHAPEMAAQLRTTGHTLEFLSLALSDEEIRQPWVTRAVVRMAAVLKATQAQDIECGALYHGMHGLVRYRHRRFGPLDLAAWARELQAGK